MNGTINVATRWQPRLEGLHRSAHASWLTAALWPSRWRAVFNYAKHCERLHKVNLPISQFKGKDFKGSIHTKSKKKTRLLTCVLCSQILGFFGGIFFKLNIDLSYFEESLHLPDSTTNISHVCACIMNENSVESAKRKSASIQQRSNLTLANTLPPPWVWSLCLSLGDLVSLDPLASLASSTPLMLCVCVWM